MNNERLLMQVALVDQVTAPLRGITEQMQNTVAASRQGMANIVMGGAGLIASGMAIQNALMPAIEMDRKIGEVASLGVTDKALKQLQNTALDFSTEYGKSATDFVAASYDIQSAISGLDGNELSAFTKSSAILAAATKADTGTITDYMGTMYGIFEASAQSMGKAKWVENMTGMTATAVKLFKTDGTKMAQAFGSLGSSATAMGADVAEQMAILGTLQATMGGGEAATKYTAFLGGAVKAQDKMGLSFTDSQGKLLPMVDILKKVDAQIGNLGEVAQYGILKDAFGSDEAVKLIQNLLPKTAQLSDNINKLGDVKGMEVAEAMAGKMTNQWDRLETSFFAVRVAVFGAVLPAINAVVGIMVDGISIVTGWSQAFPILGTVLSVVALSALAFGGAVAGLSLAMGIGQMMSAGYTLTTGILGKAFNALRDSTALMTAASWLFNASLWANPMTWVVAGIIALVAAIGVAIYYWDDIKACFADMSVFGLLGDSIEWIIDLLNKIPGVDIDMSSSMPKPEEMKTAQLTKEISAPEIKTAQLTKGIKASAGTLTAPALLEGNSLAPLSVGPDLNVASYKQSQNKTRLPHAMVQNITTMQKEKQATQRQYGDVFITTQNAITPDELAQWDELSAG